MQPHFPKRLWMTLATACGIVLATGMVAFRAQADEWDKKTILTVDQPVQVRNTLLEPGTYVFKLGDSTSDRHIVQIFNGDQSRIILTILAIPNYRLQPTDNSRFMFWETPAGSAKALRAWFYPGDNFGQEFPYPKQLKQLAALRAPVPELAPAPAPQVALAEPPTQETPAQETPAPAPPPEALKQEPPSVETAQNVNPPAPAPEAPPAPAEESLPKTASPYPVIGLAGLLSLGIYGLLRLARPV